MGPTASKVQGPESPEAQEPGRQKEGVGDPEQTAPEECKGHRKPIFQAFLN